ncbi:hypothetical protein [Pseudomonas phage PCW2]|nr:hypothetical protein [Pseudomonas phage PCW2]
MGQVTGGDGSVTSSLRGKTGSLRVACRVLRVARIGARLTSTCSARLGLRQGSLTGRLRGLRRGSTGVRRVQRRACPLTLLAHVDRITIVHAIGEVDDLTGTGVEVTIVVHADCVSGQVTGFLSDVQGLNLRDVQVVGPKDRTISEVHQTLSCRGQSANLDQVEVVSRSPCLGRGDGRVGGEAVLGVQDQLTSSCTDQGDHNELPSEILEGDREVFLGAIESVGPHRLWCSSHIVSLKKNGPPK